MHPEVIFTSPEAELTRDVDAGSDVLPAGTPVEILEITVRYDQIAYLIRAPRDPSRVFDEAYESRRIFLENVGDSHVAPALVESHVRLTVTSDFLRPRRHAVRTVVSV